MELTTTEQIFEQIKKSRKILVVLPMQLTPDSLASGLGLRLFLAKLQKEVVIASAGSVPEHLKFLPGANLLEKQIAVNKSFVITVDTSVKKLDEISYQNDPGKAQIYLKSQNQEFTPQDITFSADKFPLDLVIVLDAKSLEDLGQLYDQHTDLFFETPKINIDNKSGNEYFGAINLVDITATSVAEILAELLEKYEEQLLDEDIATCLLTGIIAKTQSFQHVQTTPKAFLKASALVSLGGRQQEIIKNIYKTKALSLLKLWGRALARMKILEEQKVIYSVLGAGDFEKAESSSEELLPALKEFLDNISGYKLIAILGEPQKNTVRLLIAVHEQLPSEKLVDSLGGDAKTLDVAFGNYKIVEQTFSQISLEEAERRFLAALEII